MDDLKAVYADLKAYYENPAPSPEETVQAVKLVMLILVTILRWDKLDD